MTIVAAGPAELDAGLERQIAARLLSPGFERWAEQSAACGHCARPVRLVGTSHIVDTATGQVIGTYDSRAEPDGVTYVRCGNRRAAVCPSCSREYQGDMWHLIRAGAAGGDKGVPTTIATHPKVFATFTAPSFGPVHTHKRPDRPGGTRCRPRRDKTRCPHGRPTWCLTAHGEDDPRTGTPLCPDCYDYPAHVVWQWWAPELWRRFTITLRRRLAAHLDLSETGARRLVRVQYVKVMEYQRRGVIHFHALIRLDGPPTDTDRFPAPRVDVDTANLARLVRDAAAATWFDAPPVDGRDGTPRLRFGTQLDARPITTAGGDTGTLSEEAVAGYIAKYATKATEDLDPNEPGTRRSPHVRRLSATVDELHTRGLGSGGVDGPYGLLSRWTRMLGYRGHCSTKSRSYSTTMGALRQTRRDHARRAARTRGPTVEGGYDLADDAAQATIVIGSWQFAGMGWLTTADAALAAMAADEARAHAQHRATQRRTAGPAAG